MNFQQLYKLVSESPDYSLGNIWEEADYCFLYYKNTLVIGYDKTTHGNISQLLFDSKSLRSQKNIPLQMKQKLIIEGGKEAEFEINGKLKEIYDVIDSHGSRMSRTPMIRAGFLLGRVWETDKICSLWNHIDTIDKEDIIGLTKKLPGLKQFYFEFSDDWTFGSNKKDNDISNPKSKNSVCGTYKQILDYVSQGDRDQEAQQSIKDQINTQDLDMLHLLSPEKKAEAMKQKGIMPKTPIPLVDRMRREGD